MVFFHTYVKLPEGMVDITILSDNGFYKPTYNLYNLTIYIVLMSFFIPPILSYGNDPTCSFV